MSWQISVIKKLGLGSACQHCGETDQDVLQIHHLKLNGKEERMKWRTPYSKEMLEHPQDYSLLCANCHLKAHARARIEFLRQEPVTEDLERNEFPNWRTRKRGRPGICPVVGKQIVNFRLGRRTYREIASELGLSEMTVYRYLKKQRKEVVGDGVVG